MSPSNLFRLAARSSLIIGMMTLVFFGARSSGRATPPKAPCPADMAWVEAGGFCIDRYEFPNREGETPVRGINFPDAKRLCESRGKRLPTHAEFRLACGGAAKNLYPYGPDYAPGKCRSALEWYDGPVPSGSYPGCVNNGVYDLTGNVWEWLQARGNQQLLAGGAWNNGPNSSNCRNLMPIFKVIVVPSAGVRCVASPKNKPDVAPGNEE